MTWLQGLDYLLAQCSSENSGEGRKKREEAPLIRCCGANPPRSFGGNCSEANLFEDGEALSCIIRERGVSLDKHLKVPACMGSIAWDRLVPSCGTKESGDIHVGLELQDSERILSKALSSFTESMKIGIEVEVVLDDGSLMDVELALDSSASRLLVRLRDVERAIPLDEISQVSGGLSQSCSQDCLASCDEERCATIMFSEQFLTFSFDSARLKEYFEACFHALLSARANRSTEIAHAAGCQRSRDVVVIPADFQPPISEEVIPRERCQDGFEEEHSRL